MNKRGILCLILTLVCSLRAFQLYWSSTRDLRSSQSWLPNFSKKKSDYSNTAAIVNKLKNDSIVLGAESNNIFYFLHVTDLHLSRYRPKGHTHHFLHFIQSILPVVKPEFVVVTGDLTDAKDKKRVTSQQYSDEWTIYQKAIEEKVIVDWYDMRGNHDCFDLPSWKSRVNYYRTHGKSANLIEQGKGVYSWQVNKKMGNYNFVAIDACPKKGPSRPLNFFGYLTSKTMDQLERAITYKSFNHTFVFSHYPTSTMVFGVSNKGTTFRDLASQYSIYFCGHLHKLIAGLGDVLKSYDPVTKSLELELGDLKEHGLYRVVAIDHDLISFVDIQLPLSQISKRGPINPFTNTVYPMHSENDTISWPAPIHPPPSILITNPKDARFSIPTKEPLWRIKQSSHIRFLVFSEMEPDNLLVEIWIDGKKHLNQANFIGNTTTPLWASAWNATEYEDRKPHKLSVRVTSKLDKKMVSKQDIVFRVDAHRIKIKGGSGEFIIKSKMSTVLICISLFTMTSMLILLLIPKFQASNPALKTRLLLRIHNIDQIALKSGFTRLQKQILIWSLRFLQLPTDQPIVWYMTLTYILALLTCPWFRADFIPSGETQAERYGTFYMWGMVFGNEWVPIADTWMFAAEQIVLDIWVFFFLVVWRGTNANSLTCRGAAGIVQPPAEKKISTSATGNSYKAKLRRQLNEMAWFKGLEIVYWLWRLSELVALASFYGGIWPTLVQNILVYWMLFVGYVLGWGKNGVFTSKRNSRFISNVVEGCIACSQQSSLSASAEFSLVREDISGAAAEKNAVEAADNHTTSGTTVLQYNSSTTLTQEEEQQKIGFISISGSSSSSSSSTPFDGNSPYIKSRKRGSNKL